MSLPVLVLFAYTLLQVGVGLYVARRVRGAGDFFVAGRGLGPGLLLASLVAANIGAGSTVGATGLGYREGLAAWWWVGSAGLGTLVLAFLVGPRIRRIAAEHDLHTVGDFLEHRYGRTLRGIVASLLWIGTLAILTGQLVAAGKILHVVTGLPPAVGAVIGGLVMTVYFTAGGLLGSAWVNALQLVVEIGTFLRPAACRARRCRRMAGRSRARTRGSRLLGLLGRRLGPALPDPPWPGLLPLARPAAEGLRSAQRPHGSRRRRPERAFPRRLCLHPDAPRHRGARPAPGARRSGAGSADAASPRPPARAGRSGAGRGVYHRREHGRRDSIHALDVAGPGPVPRLREPDRDRRAGAARGAWRSRRSEAPSASALP